MGYGEKSNLELMTMTCPKCGYEQEERLDCLKCGIVFSKFYAFHSPEKPSRPEPVEAPQAVHLPAEESPTFDMAELRQQIKDLNRRFKEVEFERAERGQIRSELRNADKKHQMLFEQFASRLEALEKQASEPAIPPPVPAPPDYTELKKELEETHLDPLLKRLNELDQRLTDASSEKVPQTELWVVEVLNKLDLRVGDLEGRLSSLIAEYASKDSASALQDLQAGIQCLRGDVETFAEHVSKESASALQDLKSSMQSLRADLDTLGEHVAKESAAALQDLQNSMRSLKTDLDALARRVSVESADALQDLHSSMQSLRGELDTLAERASKESANTLQNLQNGHRSLKADVDTLKAALDHGAGIGDQLSIMRAEANHSEERLQLLEERLERLSSPPPEEKSLPPLEADVRSIRESLEEIRRFMSHLSKKG